MRMHRSITLDRITDAVERSHSALDDPGFCVACGHEVDGVEPDARKYTCEGCGEDAVYGAEELSMRMVR
jgi:predicted RNA-binding Zn-ribbon protein involved in translation (DUF1610 family)